MFWQCNPCSVLLWMQRSLSNTVKVLSTPENPVLWVDMSGQQKVGLIGEPHVIQELFFFVDLLSKPPTHGDSPILINLGEQVSDLNPIGIEFQDRDQNTSNWRTWDPKQLTPTTQWLARASADRVSNPVDILRCPHCNRSSGRWLCSFSSIFYSTIGLKLTNNLENFTFVRVMVEIKLTYKLAWAVLNDLVSWYVFTQKTFCSVVHVIVI